jgi:hypothetical protein
MEKQLKKQTIILSIITILTGACANMPKNEYHQDRCKVEYRFENPSLGPIYGKRNFMIVLQKGNPTQIIDLDTGQEAEKNLGTPGLHLLLDALKGKKKNDLLYQYDNHGKLISIKSRVTPGQIGAQFSLKLLYNDCP